MTEPMYIPVSAETHARYFAQMDELGLGSDAFVRRLLLADDQLRKVAAVAKANGTGAIGAELVLELAEPELAR